MVVAEGPNEYILYAQNDHGDLAGQFAAHWGNDKFAPLKPRDSMVFAAEAHDNGWWYWDVNPEVDDQGVPVTFRRTPRARLYEFIDKGIDNIIAKDLYAGLIASIHHAGLPQHRYGTLPAVPRRHDEYTTAFINRREPLNQELIAKVGAMKEYDGANSKDFIWFNYRMMQVFDRLSLFFCCNYDLETATASEGTTQREKDYGRAFYTSSINATPVRFGHDDVELRLTPASNTKLVVEPYPFDEAPLKVTVRGRRIGRLPFRTQEEFRDVYRRQPRETFEYTLVPN
jgi:hypothetical protein